MKIRACTYAIFIGILIALLTHEMNFLMDPIPVDLLQKNITVPSQILLTFIVFITLCVISILGIVDRAVLSLKRRKLGNNKKSAEED